MGAQSLVLPQEEGASGVSVLPWSSVQMSIIIAICILERNKNNLLSFWLARALFNSEFCSSSVEWAGSFSDF